MTLETRKTPKRKWSAAALLAVGTLAFLSGAVLQPVWQPVRAEVTPGEPRKAFLDGGVIANQTLEQQLVILKRMDERIARIEKALLDVVDK